ncbi:uncharacterized protein LOC6539519 [Drosophila yakuba]|uniref:Drosophila melanogaster n=2 Tax=Drosophila yakuba TaxID=7245 RepID=B4ITU3_DROYA|nr:uncharacterized protein LOC6539519 [Drosophila yakuba]EDW99806.1 uncharacterized protein Dyak_GE22888 [Drosophila yakuba]
MRSVLNIVVFFTILCLMILKPSGPVVFKLTNVVCDSFNKTWVRINQCRLKAINRYRTVFNFNATFLYPTNDVFVHYHMYKRENGYKPWLIKTQVDGCRFMRKPYDPFGILIFKMYRNFTNVNHTCPYYGEILVRNMYLSTTAMRLPLPTGDYLLAMNWLFYGKTQFDTNVSFQFVEDIL